MTPPEPKRIRSRPFYVAATLGLLIVVSVADYLTGVNISLSVFYLLGIGFATWFVNRGFGLFISSLSVIAWLIGDIAAGAQYKNRFVPVWNGLILLVFYFVVVWLLAKLRSANRDLEKRVRLRSAALTHEIAERERLERELLDISEREQRRIGHDLHDNFCQHLISTAMASQVLREKLTARSAAEVPDAARIVSMVEDGIAMARELARGLSPVELEAEGLMSALQELATGMNKWAKVVCTFECESSVFIHDPVAAAHLYRIAQEAVSNAIRHGKAQHIVISLDEDKTGICLSVEDDGCGLAENWQAGNGLGTRIMAHRAASIGGIFTIEPNLTGGTLVRCRFQPRPIHEA
jgi:signal transduction histidine kinase